MSDPKFTPGPYRYRADRTVSAANVQLCRCYAGSNEAANGPLFAAAPNLYGALSDVLEDLHVYEFKTGKGREVVSEEHFNAARDALAHARGEAL